MKKLFLFLICTLFCLTSCKEHFSDGERVGTVTKFSKAGVLWDSWDGHLNVTQTGMNSAGEPFAFSLDNDRSDQDSIVNLLSEAQLKGWKIKLLYHQVWGFKNVFRNRGESNYFIDDVEILDKNFSKPLENLNSNKGSVIDTIYVVIDKSKE